MRTMNGAIRSLWQAGWPGFGMLRQTGQDLVRLWMQRSRERRELAELPPELLRDIGLDRAEALHEASRPFWDGRPRRHRAGWEPPAWRDGRRGWGR